MSVTVQGKAEPRSIATAMNVLGIAALGAEPWLAVWPHRTTATSHDRSFGVPCRSPPKDVDESGTTFGGSFIYFSTGS